MSSESPARLASAEFVGTTLVVLGGPGLLVLGGPEIGTTGVAIGFGISLAVAIGVLGAVANPMFSLALWLAKAISLKEAVSDWVGQLLGGVFGGAVLWGLSNTTGLTTGVNGWQPGNGVDSGVDLGVTTGPFAELGVVLAAELVFATLLVTVLLSAIREQRSNAATAAFVGATATVATLFLLPISGSGLNPARSLGTAIFADTSPNALGQVWLFIVVPIVAAVAGLLVWLAIDEATIDDTVFDDTIVETIADKAADLVD